MGGNDHFPIRDRPMGVTNDKSAATPGPCFLAGSLGHQYDSGRASRVPVSLHAPEFLVHRWCFIQALAGGGYQGGSFFLDQNPVWWVLFTLSKSCNDSGPSPHCLSCRQIVFFYKNPHTPRPA